MNYMQQPTKRGRHTLTIEAFRDAVSIAWASCPPPGAEDWTDDEWEEAIEREARRQYGAGIVARMDARRERRQA